MKQRISMTQGFNEDERAIVAGLYWQAFGAKLGKLLGPETRALEFLCDVLDPNFAITARGNDGTVLGVAGFKTAKGAMVGGGLQDLARHYGWMGTVWRAPLLALVERDIQDGVLLMDGICVKANARGLGVGTALLHAIKDQAVARGLVQVRLDVINSNPRARALYERIGFVEQGTEQLGPLRHLFGFDGATKMKLEIK